MRFFPTIELTPQVEQLLAHGALALQPGQWVRRGERRGRYLRTNPNTGVSYVSWLRPGDDMTTHSQRFHRACVKGYVGKYSRYYDLVRAMRNDRADGAGAAWAA
ncbi:MAG TPA: hypothetical protein VEH84_14105 [Alphaproteobacteria bacterium]|nr:hypothetical protein [Alphaproteobacteria bacterium]